MPQVYRAIRPMFKRNKWRICRDDLVQIIRGPEKGQVGRVLEVIKDDRVPQVIVEGKNLVSPLAAGSGTMIRCSHISWGLNRSWASRAWLLAT